MGLPADSMLMEDWVVPDEEIDEEEEDPLAVKTEEEPLAGWGQSVTVGRPTTAAVRPKTGARPTTASRKQERSIL